MGARGLVEEHAGGKAEHRPVTVFTWAAVTCFWLEAQRQTGHVVGTIREYSQKGLQTADGYSYQLGELLSHHKKGSINNA